MAYDYAGALRAAIGMGGAGLAVGGPLAPFFAGAGALAGLAAGFGKTPRQRQEEQYDELLRKIASSKLRVLDEGTQRINRAMAGAMSQAAGGGARRAAAEGKTSETEGYILPGQAAIAAKGVEGQREFISGTEAEYEKAAMDVEAMKAGLPLEPAATDILSMIGEGTTDALQAIEKYKLEEELRRQRESRKTAGGGGGTASSPLGLAAGEQLPAYADALRKANRPAFTGLPRTDLLAEPKTADVTADENGIRFKDVETIMDTYRRGRMTDYGDKVGWRRY